MKQKLIWIFVLIVAGRDLSAQVPAPGKKQNRAMVILHAIIHDGNGNKIPDGWLRAEAGRITSMGSGNPDMSVLLDAEVTDAKQSHLYPGFILLNNPVGLAEIEAVRATIDMQETGLDNPNVHSLPAYNTDSDVIPTLRLNGVLMAQVTPRGGRISGLSSVVQLDAWNWEDAVIKARDGMHINWPSRWNRQGWWAEPSGGAERNKEYVSQLNELTRLFEEALQYRDNPEKRLNPKAEALVHVLNGRSRLYLHASGSAGMIAALEFARSFGITNPVLVAGPEVLDILPYLKENNIPVVLNRLHDLPLQSEAPVYQQVKVPVELHRAGILFALDYEGSMEIMGARNLGFLAGSVRAHGIAEEEALSLITRNPARILGLEKICGTLETGKDATFFLSSGDALEMKSQQLKKAWIQGREIRLESKQTLLYEKFRKMLAEGR